MLNRLPLWRMRELLQSGQASSVDLIQAHVRQIRSSNPAINAFTEVYMEEALAQAGAATPGPLCGIPVTVKDSFDSAGRVTFCGSQLRRTEKAQRDSTAVARLKNAGAILIGRTATPEFLYYYETDNRLTGRVNHPANPSFTPGGSSGGEAAAIASFMSAGGVGSDGGGSIREPAHFCGICGLKPTPGRVSAAGHWPEITHPTGFMGVAGPMARNARDLRILFEALCGYDVRDPFSVPIPLRPLSAKDSRIFVIDQFPVEAACRDAAERAAFHLHELRHRVERFPFGLLEGAHELWRVLFVDLITQNLRTYIAGREPECSWTGLELMRYARENVDTARLSAVLAQRDRLRATLLEWMGDDTILLAPAFGTTAFPHRQPSMDILEAVRPVSPWNLLGFPSLVLPLCVGDNGMPAGVQLIGAPYTEERLLDLAAGLELARGEQWQTPTSSPISTTNTTSTTG
jgi:Asp-tRNA(Asn)/Glu-tRNA(Gln) amidotransferase A subunit family amidase